MSAGTGLTIDSDGAAIDPQILIDLQRFRYTHARIDLQRFGYPDHRAQPARPADLHTTHTRTVEVQAMGIQAVPIVSRATQLPVLFPTGAIPELGNEPDLEKFLNRHFEGNFWTYLREVEASVDLAVEAGHLIFVGAVSNITKHERNRGLRFLERLPWGKWTSERHRECIGASVHWYPDDLDLEEPHEGYGSNDDAVGLLRSIVGPRPLMVSEVGIHDGALSETEVAIRLSRFRRYLHAMGFVIVIGFGLNDGVDPPGQYHADNHYGFRRLDGSWKPVAHAFAED